MGSSATVDRTKGPQVLCGVMKWCWSRLPGGVVTWEAYELFRVGEQGTIDLGARSQWVLTGFDQTPTPLEMPLRPSFPSALIPTPEPRSSLISSISWRRLLLMVKRTEWEDASCPGWPAGGHLGITTRRMALREGINHGQGSFPSDWNETF